MRRAAMVLVLLVLAGCGQPERPYSPGAEPSADGSGTARAAAPTESPQEGTGEEETLKGKGKETVAMGGGKFRVEIDWPAKRDPLAEVGAAYMVAMRKALVAGSDRPLQDIDIELTAAQAAYEWVKYFLDRKQTVRGVARLYDLRVSRTGKGAVIDMCVDEAGMRFVSARTGKAISPRPDWLDTPYLQSLAMHRGDDDVWRIRDVRADLKGCPA
ncbi:hypothetical protein [Nonomuraea wenchangensis]|uniref:Lipoprotein n=1 Tax=Nonomuraea wenchangensis TaxID=568860 RepID=A0A1I0LAD4_9ACTN|nr:hypothetical protein [Nonomuraea wenchangensis]SEU36905.1 hypothetical protein SAMN05421811_11436 [Nonomuraea wenchangensis]